jgi:hypothetical protein
VPKLFCKLVSLVYEVQQVFAKGLAWNTFSSPSAVQDYLTELDHSAPG